MQYLISSFHPNVANQPGVLFKHCCPHRAEPSGTVSKKAVYLAEPLPTQTSSNRMLVIYSTREGGGDVRAWWLDFRQLRSIISQTHAPLIFPRAPKLAETGLSPASLLAGA